MNEIIKKRIELAAWFVAEKLTDGAFKSACIKNFSTGAKYALQNQWISVKEGMPNPMEEVVAIDENDNTSLAQVSVSGVWVVNKTNFISDVAFDYGKITHWMPIPKLKRDED